MPRIACVASVAWPRPFGAMCRLNLHTCSKYNVSMSNRNSWSVLHAVAAARNNVIPSNNMLRWNVTSHLFNTCLHLSLILFATAEYLPHVSLFHYFANSGLVDRMRASRSGSFLPSRWDSLLP